MTHEEETFVRQYSRLPQNALDKIKATLESDTPIAVGDWVSTTKLDLEPCGCLMMDGYLSDPANAMKFTEKTDKVVKWIVYGNGYSWQQLLLDYYGMDENHEFIINDCAEAFDNLVSSNGWRTYVPGYTARLLTPEGRKGVLELLTQVVSGA